MLNEVWSWDFVHDRTDNGMPLKILTLITEYSRQCLRIDVGRKVKSKDVLDALAGAMAEGACLTTTGSGANASTRRCSSA